MFREILCIFAYSTRKCLCCQKSSKEILQGKWKLSEVGFVCVLFIKQKRTESHQQDEIPNKSMKKSDTLHIILLFSCSEQ